jgi:hypothetical protein
LRGGADLFLRGKQRSVLAHRPGRR